MKKKTLISIVLLCIFVSFGLTYFYIGDIKDIEQFEMKDQFEIELLNKEKHIENLTDQLSQFIGDENMLIGTWTRFLGNGSIFFDTIYIYSNKTAGLYYNDSALWNVSYTIENGILLFVGGTAVRDFSYCFFDENTLVVSNPYPGWSVDPKAVYIKS